MEPNYVFLVMRRAGRILCFQFCLVICIDREIEGIIEDNVKNATKCSAYVFYELHINVLVWENNIKKKLEILKLKRASYER